MKPIFSRSEVSDVDTLDFHVGRFLDLIASDGSTVNLQEPLHNLVNDNPYKQIEQNIDIEGV